MSITAKYASTCPTCRQRITVGSRVEWAPGSPARHVGCAAPVGASSTPRRSTARPGTTYEPGVGRTCDECGEVARRGTRCWETGAAH